MSRPEITRREFLEAATAAGGAALLAGCEPGPREAVTAAPPPLVKDPAPFLQHGTNLETRLEQLRGVITPNDLFFVRNNAPTPRIDATTYRLRIEGDAVERPLALSLADLTRLPGRSRIACLECAGNWRGFFAKLLGRTGGGSPGADEPAQRKRLGTASMFLTAAEAAARLTVA